MIYKGHFVKLQWIALLSRPQFLPICFYLQNKNSLSTTLLLEMPVWPNPIISLKSVRKNWQRKKRRIWKDSANWRKVVKIRKKPSACLKKNSGNRSNSTHQCAQYFSRKTQEVVFYFFRLCRAERSFTIRKHRDRNFCSNCLLRSHQ